MYRAQLGCRRRRPTAPARVQLPSPALPRSVRGEPGPSLAYQYRPMSDSFIFLFTRRLRHSTSADHFSAFVSTAIVSLLRQIQSGRGGQRELPQSVLDDRLPDRGDAEVDLVRWLPNGGQEVRGQPGVSGDVPE